MGAEIKEPEFYEDRAFAWVAGDDCMIVSLTDDFREELITAYSNYYGLNYEDFQNAMEEGDYSYRGNALEPLMEDEELEDCGEEEWELLYNEVGMNTGSLTLISLIEKLGFEVLCDRQSEEAYDQGAIYYVE